MSTCTRCGATFHCTMSDSTIAGDEGQPCWCTQLPPAVPVPGQDESIGCWCPACLRAHIDGLQREGLQRTPPVSPP